MANDITAIGSALYGYLGTAGTVGVYYGNAPHGSALPFCTVQRQAATDDYTFDSHGVGTDYVIKVVSDRNWPGEAAEVYTHIHSAIQDAPLTVTGFSLLRCRRDSTLEYRDGDGYWHVGGLYSVDVHET